MLLQAELALRIAALKNTIGLAVNLALTLRTGSIQIVKLSIHNRVIEALCLLDNLLGQIIDLGHETGSRQLAKFHLLQLVFPLTRHLWRTQSINADRFQ